MTPLYWRTTSNTIPLMMLGVFVFLRGSVSAFWKTGSVSGFWKTHPTLWMCYFVFQQLFQPFEEKLFSQETLTGQNRTVKKGGQGRVEKVLRWGKRWKLYWGYGIETFLEGVTDKNTGQPIFKKLTWFEYKVSGVMCSDSLCDGWETPSHTQTWWWGRLLDVALHHLLPWDIDLVIDEPEPEPEGWCQKNTHT